MTRFHWVRHGPTHARGMVGWRDLPADLSDTALIERVSRSLPAGAIVISSDLIRAADTASAIGAQRARLPHAPGLREFDFGIWDGMVFDDIAARDPILSRRFWEEPGDIRAPEGESWNDLAGRVNAVVDELAGTHQGRDIIAVAHFGVILTQVHRAMGGTPYQALGHRIDNFSITETALGSEGWRLGRVNHLP